MNTETTKWMHTPEPWRYAGGAIFADSRVGTVYDQFVFDGDGGNVVAATIYTSANGCRIVECVNACKGINPEAVPDLLLACEQILTLARGDVSPHDEGESMQQAILAVFDAIAKAKGGAA